MPHRLPRALRYAPTLAAPPTPATPPRLVVRRRRATPIQYGAPPLVVLLPGWAWWVSDANGRILDSGTASTWLAAHAQGRDALADATACR